jgi:DNA-binding beta-propeller fold protein YncE
VWTSFWLPRHFTVWVGDNFTVGWQGQDALWQGNFRKFAPNGKPLSPMTTGFYGGGFAGGTFGNAVDDKDNVWLTSYGGHAISKFDKNGKSLAGSDGITFNDQLGLMQGVIVAPSSDVWMVGLSKNQVVYIPKGDPAKAKLLCEGFKDEPCKSLRGPFHLGIDQQNRIWVTNAMGDSVARFPASDPTKVETFKAGFSGSGLGIDSLGNVWVTNRLGSSARGGAAMEAIGKVIKSGGDLDEVLTRAMAKQTGGADGGSVTVLRPDGTQYPARRSPVADFPVLGLWPWTATQLLRFSQ